MILIIAALALATIAPNVTKLMMSKEDKLALTYTQFNYEDKKIEGCDNVQFLAYFPRDINKDKVAEMLAGTTLNISSPYTNEYNLLYLDLNVISDGTLEDAKITFSNGSNYKVYMYIR